MIRASSARFACLFAAAAAYAGAQHVDFECQPPGPIPPLAGPADCDGLVSNGNPAGQVTVQSAPNCSMPTNGSRYARLVAKEVAAAAVPVGTILPRPFAPALTELRVPLGGALAFQLDFAFHQKAWGFPQSPLPASINDGFDVSVVDSGGARIALIARGDAANYPSPLFGCPQIEHGNQAFIQPLPAGAYLSIVVYNAGVVGTDSELFVDNVQVVRSGCSFECEPAGSAFVPSWNCEGAAGRTGAGGSVAVSTFAQCGLPSEGGQYARLVADGAVVGFTSGATLSRPIPADFTTLYVPVPATATFVAFDYAFVNLEGTNVTSYFDGFDVSIVDAAGNRLQLLLKGDAGAANYGCNGVQHFGTAIPTSAVDRYLSFVVFNADDYFFPSELLVDYVCFGLFPALRYSSPLGPGSLAARIDCGPPGQVYYTPTTIAPGTFPYGAFGGVDISLLDVFTQILLGPPFIGVFDATGSATMPAFTGLPSGLTLYANVISNITTTTTIFGPPVSYTIP